MILCHHSIPQFSQGGACTVADRKQFQNIPAPDPRLISLLKEARKRDVTEAELQEQRVSFAFGNAPASSRINKDSVRTASTHIRLL
jgi:hypothetical protein